MTRSLNEYNRIKSERGEAKLQEKLKIAAKAARRNNWQARKNKRWAKRKPKLKNYGLEQD